MSFSRRTVLQGLAVGLAAPTLVRAQSAPETLRATLPDWMTLRLAVPNSPDAATRYADYDQVGFHGDRFVSENKTKTLFTVPDQPAGEAGALNVDLSSYSDQQADLARLSGRDDVPFDLHGMVWHNSLSPVLKAHLARSPADWRPLLDRLMQAHLADDTFPRFDINEIARTTHPVDPTYDYWRGPASSVKNGSAWFEAAEQAGDWPHGPGFWWLHPAIKAWDYSAKVIFQDFGLDAGRPWGAGDRTVPAGFEGRRDEMVKRRQMLDAINYALAHGGRIDVFGFQAHLNPGLALDAADLRLFLASLASMGVESEITEFDIAPASRHAPVSAEDYGAAFLALLLKHSDLHQFGAWSGWAPKDQPWRHTVIDRDGITDVGRAIARAAQAATPPDDRAKPEIQRHYQLCFGVTPVIWRAARDSTKPGFEIDGSARGTRVLAGSGGALLPITGETFAPGQSVPPVWRENGRIITFAPSAMSLRFQWHQDQSDLQRGGPILTLMSDHTSIMTLAIEKGQIRAAADSAQIDLATAPGFASVALSWFEGTLQIATDTGETGSLALQDRSTCLILLGDGQDEAPFRATDLTLYRDPVADGTALRQRARQQGSEILTADAIMDLARPS